MWYSSGCHFLSLYQIKREKNLSLSRFANVGYQFLFTRLWYNMISYFFACFCCFFQNFLTFLFFILHDQHPFFSRSRPLFPLFCNKWNGYGVGMLHALNIHTPKHKQKEAFFSLTEERTIFLSNRIDREKRKCKLIQMLHNTAFEKEKLDWLMWQSERFAHNDDTIIISSWQIQLEVQSLRSCI